MLSEQKHMQLLNKYDTSLSYLTAGEALVVRVTHAIPMKALLRDLNWLKTCSGDEIEQ